MEILFLLCIVGGVILLIVKINFDKDDANETSLPSYRLINPLSPAELNFYRVLYQAINNEAIIFSKVRVADTITPTLPNNTKEWYAAFNKISAKHFDFIIVDDRNAKIIAAIELDDKSHNNKKRIERDKFLNKVCSDAGLPLYRFRASKSYSINEIRERIIPNVTSFLNRTTCDPGTSSPISDERQESKGVKSEP